MEVNDIQRNVQQDDEQYPMNVPDAQCSQESAPSQADLVTVDGMDTGQTGRLPTTRRKNLLNKDVGLNDLNMGRSAYMAGALKPFKVLVEFLQTYTRPHHVMRYSTWQRVTSESFIARWSKGGLGQRTHQH